MPDEQLRRSEIVLEHHRAEAAAGFPLARRLPCTDLVSKLHYLEVLPADRLDCLFLDWHKLRTEHADALTDWGWVKTVGAKLPEALAFQRHRETLNVFRRLDTMPVKMAANLYRDGGDEGLKNWQQAVGLPDDALSLRPELAGGYDELVSAKPAKIRKALDTLMTERFGAVQGEVLGIKNWQGEADGIPFLLRATFAASGGRPQQHQFDYGVTFGGDMTLSGLPGAYESYWWARPSWDYLTETNLAGCMDALGDTLVVMAGLYRDA